MCTDGQPQTSCDTDGHTQTATDVLCVLTDTHRRPPMRAKITRTVHGEGQRVESKDQRADMCTDGQPRTSYSPRGPKSPEQSTGRVSVLSPRTNVLICVLMDSHERPVCADGHTRTATDDLHGRPVQPTWDKISQTVHGKGQGAESKDQRADMCTDGQPRTSYSPRGPKSPEQSTGMVSVLSPRTNVLICVLMDSHGRPVCADGHKRTATDILCVLTDTHGRPVVLICVLMDSHRHHVCADGHTRTHTDVLYVLCVMTDSHGQPQTSCVCWRTPRDVLCVLNRPPTWAKMTQTVHGKGQLPKRAKITRTVHRKGQSAESNDQRADMCTDGQPRTSCVC
ncbi:unnamed protein product [Brassica rapa]|uniref:Uncharacterized protein n=1 Tax=Brassica campestris TaxID=3711 RepID=A0A8D9DBY7_BRACM|nr:unnamed protein product [Brassica rapa]